MKHLLRVSGLIDRVTAGIGHGVAWLILVAVLISAGNAAVRKAFDMSSNAWLELQWYLFSAVFLLAASHTLRRNEHIRIDIVSNMLSKRTRDWIDLVGHLVMLMPFVVLMIYEGTPFLLTSFEQQEVSANAGGLILWPVKSLVLLGFGLLFFQGVSEIVKRIAVIRGLIPDPAPEHHASPLAEEEMMIGESRRD